MSDREIDAPDVEYPVGVDASGRVTDASGREVIEVASVLAQLQAKPNPSVTERRCMEAIRRRLRAAE